MFASQTYSGLAIDSDFCEATSDTIAGFANGQTAFTVECWFRALDTTDGLIFGNRDYSVDDPGEFWGVEFGSGAAVRFASSASAPSTSPHLPDNRRVAPVRRRRQRHDRDPLLRRRPDLDADRPCDRPERQPD